MLYSSHLKGKEYNNEKSKFSTDAADRDYVGFLRIFAGG